MGQGGAVSCVVTIAIGVVLLIIILVAVSFQGVEYYEMGFVRRKTSGTVDTSIVYQAGHHYVGLDAEFKVFKADAHMVSLESIGVFTRDRLEVSLDCTFQYFLRPEDLKLLHDTYDLQYEDTLRNSAVDALKGATSAFSPRDFGSDRALIEETLFAAIRRRLGGTCCKPFCQDLPEGCEPGCKQPEDCTDEDKGLYADVRYFQLGYVKIPEEVLGRNLQTLTQLEDGEREIYRQQEQLVRKTTEEIVTNIENAAEEIFQNATAQAALIGSRAQADSRAKVENSHSLGLARIYSDLNITEQDQKASLNYIRTLRDHSTVFLTVNFNSLVTGPVYGSSNGGR
ncbi:uncharacterized protein LOC119746287 [Patiria miniata]|uniref:Band 7 domain-containing protein n=1 Tax=Patiria miniata TaxID=46514 RepID=A0A914BSD0_PATMI|nr:uncharacterized protein LOC119746287 [Patiria miniata]XP_038079075.1 uncharacterized protein LOC119746287 [Patiria miniata]XP_038079084.1 uncharacterized protein LOC119746287 [Patiria miniata]